MKTFDSGNLVSFTQSYPDGVRNTSTASAALLQALNDPRNTGAHTRPYRAGDRVYPIAQFPSFAYAGAALPRLGYSVWRGTAHAHLGINISAASGDLYGHGASFPVTALFDPETHAAVAMGPAAAVAKHACAAPGPDDGSYKFGPRTTLPSLPANYTYETFLASGDDYMQALYTYGAALRLAAGNETAKRHHAMIQKDNVVRYLSVFEVGGDGGGVLGRDAGVDSSQHHTHTHTHVPLVPRLYCPFTEGQRLLSQHEQGMRC